MCLQLLSTEANKPGKLKRHLDTKHPQYKDKDASFFKRNEKEYVQLRSKMMKMATVTKKALKASSLTSLRVAKSKKAHTIGEELLQPAAVEMCELMVGPEALSSSGLYLFPTAQYTDILKTCHQILSTNLLSHSKVCGIFAILLDEYTVSKAAQLLIYVRYPWEKSICEEFLFCKSLPE